MKLPSQHLPEPYRSAIRYAIVGVSGTAIQYALYWWILQLFDMIGTDASLTNIAYTTAYLLEVICNYIFTSYYTFSSRPRLRNLGGFAVGKLSSFLIQIVLLNGLLLLSLSEEVSGLLAMIIAGFINYFIVRFFFNKDKRLQDGSPRAKKEPKGEK